LSIPSLQENGRHVKRREFAGEFCRNCWNPKKTEQKRDSISRRRSDRCFSEHSARSLASVSEFANLKNFRFLAMKRKIQRGNRGEKKENK